MIRVWVVGVVVGAACGAAGLWAQGAADDPQLRALKILRDTVVQQERRDAPALTNVPPPTVPSFAELERMYLDGKLTARQFQQYVRDYKLSRPKPTPATNPPTPAQVAATNQPAGDTPPSDVPPGLEAGEDEAARARLAELEAKMDELLRQRTNRAQAQPEPSATSTGPKTKRDRLNELLRLMIQGKISQAEYEARRAKIIEEPDPEPK